MKTRPLQWTMPTRGDLVVGALVLVGFVVVLPWLCDLISLLFM